MLLNEGHLTRWSGNYCCFFILHILPPLSLQERLIRSGQGTDGTDRHLQSVEFVVTCDVPV